MKKIKPWMWVAAGVGILWWVSRPKTGAQAGATGTAVGAASGFDAGRHMHHGGGHRGHARIALSPSYTFVGNDYAGCECTRWVCPPEV